MPQTNSAGDSPASLGAAHEAALPIAPSLQSVMAAVPVPTPPAIVDRRTLLLSRLAVGLGLVAAVVAHLLTMLIALVTNAAFFGRLSAAPASPSGHHLGLLVVIPPLLGGLLVGMMARYGSRAIRGHGIPEAMEQVLTNESRIPPRITFLKPLSAAIAIGTGGPFGAEGPIIATGGALGSVLGQVLHTSAAERKVLLAAGAAAGMAATFGSPIAAVLLAVELLLFELTPRSVIPVALASITGAAARHLSAGSAAVFPMPELPSPSGSAVVFYLGLGLIVGVAAVGVTRLVYWIEDQFEKLPVHWMFWPAIGAVAVGVVGFFAPRTLGVGYDNIEQIVTGELAGGVLLFLCLMKLISWSIYLGSGTSGGTLAPLFTIGGGLGALIGAAVNARYPELGVDPRIAGLVGMAAMFAGASRALLASVVFALETTRSTAALLPLLAGCTSSYLLSWLMMRTTIMTEKIIRRGVRVPSEYTADFLEQLSVRDAMSAPVVTLRSDQTAAEVQSWLAHRNGAAQHQGFPIVDPAGQLIGVLTRRDLLGPEHRPDVLLRDLVRMPPVTGFADTSLRQAADHMVRNRVGRLPIVDRADPSRLLGIITRSDLLAAHRRRLDAAHRRRRTLRIRPRAHLLRRR
ncbi:MAG: chloride channel protein [Actinomycetota bacterium]